MLGRSEGGTMVIKISIKITSQVAIRIIASIEIAMVHLRETPPSTGDLKSFAVASERLAVIIANQGSSDDERNDNL
jgi:hypothetical protein